MKSSSKKRLILFIVILVIVVIAVTAVIVSVLLKNKKPSVEESLKRSIEKYTVPSDDLKEYAKVNEMAEIQAKYSELRRIEIISKTKDAVTLKIIAPDLKPLMLEVIDSDVEIKDYAEEMVLLEEKVNRMLKSGDLQYIESVVSVPYTVAEDSTVQIKETEEFYDAIYGGLITFIKGYEGDN